MKKLSKLILATALICCGCSVTLQNAMLNHNYSNDNLNLRLQNENYKIIKQVSGQASAMYWLTIGGLSDKANKIFASSYNNMVSRANLQANQAIINVVSEKRANVFFYPVFSRQVVHTTGTVIEFVSKEKITNTVSVNVESAPSQIDTTNTMKEQKDVASSDEKTSKFTLCSQIIEDKNGNKALIVSLSEDGQHGKAIKVYSTATYSYEQALSKCKLLGTEWRLPKIEELSEIFNVRLEINRELKKISDIIYSGWYWCSESNAMALGSETLELKQKKSGYIIAVYEF